MSWFNDPRVEEMVEQNRPFGGGGSRRAPSRPAPRPLSGDDNRRPTGRGATSRLGGALRGIADRVGRIDDDRDRRLQQQVSRLGVDPRSPQGQEILVLLMSGIPLSDPMVKEQVDDYQQALIGPQSKRTRQADPMVGPGLNQYGYKAGEEFTLLDGMSTEVLARVQDRMAALGMVEGYLPGRKDKATRDAFAELLWMANGEGKSWMQTLYSLERQKEEMGDDWAWGDDSGSGGRGKYVAPTYLAPDYATLAQRVKTELRDQLGRDPDESELALLTAELSGWDREAFDAEVEAAKAEYDAAEDGRSESPTVQTIDPLARFKESFEQKYAAERRGLERNEETEQTQEIVQAGVSRLSQMSGGMG